MNINARNRLALNAKNLSLRQTSYHRAKTMGFFDITIRTPRWLKDGFKAVAGLVDAIGDTVKVLINQIQNTIKEAISAYVETLKEVGRTINLVALAAIGRVPLSKVFDSLGKIFQNVGNYLVITNPVRFLTTFLKEAPLTTKAFSELDKFTGGLITNVSNISDLPYRAMRGDPISKQELLRDILTIVQIAALVFAGPAGVGLFVGNLIGKQVCSKQTKAQDLCKASFSILGAATGQFLVTDANYLGLIESAGEDYIRSRGIDQATMEIVRFCQRNNIVGDNECKYVGQAVANYIVNVAEGEKDFDDFLVDELKRIASQEIVDAVMDLFPDNHPTKIKIQRQIVYKDIYLEAPQSQTGLFLLLAGGATLFLLGAS